MELLSIACYASRAGLVLSETYVIHNLYENLILHLAYNYLLRYNTYLHVKIKLFVTLNFLITIIATSFVSIDLFSYFFILLCW